MRYFEINAACKKVFVVVVVVYVGGCVGGLGSRVERSLGQR